MNEANDNSTDYFALTMSGAASSEISGSPLPTFGEPEIVDTGYELGGRSGKTAGSGSANGTSGSSGDTGNSGSAGNSGSTGSSGSGDAGSDDESSDGKTGSSSPVTPSIITLKTGGDVNSAPKESDFEDSTSRTASRRDDAASERSEIVAARGTAEGLILRLDGRVSGEALKSAIAEFLVSRKTFLSGNDVALEWVGAKPAATLVEEISTQILKPYDIRVRASRVREPAKPVPGAPNVVPPGARAPHEASSGEKRIGGLQSASAYALGRSNDTKFENEPSTSGRTLSIFDGIEALRERENRGDREGRGESVSRERKAGATASLIPTGAFGSGAFGFDGSAASSQEARPDEVGKAFYERAYHERAVEERSRLANELNLWDDPDARVIYATLRSGQRVESEHSIIVFGDVNSGAEIISGGDIVVLGSLRGVAHAGAYDESGGGRVIFALKLQATQLRIGTIISRGEAGHQNVPELARVDGTVILVEPYQSRSLWGRR